MKKLHVQYKPEMEFVHHTMIDKIFSEPVYMIVQEDGWPFLYKTVGVLAFKTREAAEEAIKEIKPHHENKKEEAWRREYFRVPKFI